MNIGIIGFQTSGKTTVFTALTGIEPRDAARTKTNIAVVKVPDPRVDALVEHAQPKKIVHATVEYVDLAGLDRPDTGGKAGLGDAQLAALANTEALLVVIRAFDDGAGIPLDVPTDIEAVNLELYLTDLQKIENRLPRLEKTIGKVSGAEQERSKIEKAALEKLKDALENNRPVRSVPLSEAEEKSVRGFTFLTAKPMLVLINTGEKDLPRGNDILKDFGLSERTGDVIHTALCARIESEIALLPQDERADFLKDYNISEPGAGRVIRLCHELLGAITFFTVGPKEVHAWTLLKGSTALQAAGKIHSDIERGFIRAEVVPWDKLIHAGGFPQARKNADLRLEGKEYIVQDGDIVHILCN